MKQEAIIAEIRKKCGYAEYLPSVGWHFCYRRRHFFYMAGNETMLRFCIPHLVKASEYDEGQLTEAMNETNRNVKFIKAVLLDCGSISLDYDHRTSPEEPVETLIPHMIETLDFASTYFMNKLKGL